VAEVQEKGDRNHIGKHDTSTMFYMRESNLKRMGRI